MGLLAPNPRKFFEKNLTKNFQTGVQCEHRLFIGRAHYFRKQKKTPVSKFLKDRRFGGKKNFFQKVFFPPHKTIYSLIYLKLSTLASIDKSNTL